MTRRFGGGKLVLATHNAGKLREITALLAPCGVEILSAAALGLPEPAETEQTFAGNAGIKSHAAAASGLPALADDSGLEIEALGGAPGVHTADWAETGNGRDFMRAMTRARDEIAATGAAPPHRARFVSCLSLAWPDGHEEIFVGTAEGRITWPPRGERGFGYDPIFVPEGNTLTYGELDPAWKHAHSHRADAFRQLVAACFGGDG